MGNPLYYAAATVLLCAVCGGCATTISYPSELESYSAYGGRWQRTDRHHGRVGSLFAPAGGQIAYDEASADGRDEGDDVQDSLPSPDDADSDAQQPDSAQPGDSVLQDNEAQDLEEREQRLRGMQLEDIRLQP